MTKSVALAKILEEAHPAIRVVSGAGVPVAHGELCGAGHVDMEWEEQCEVIEDVCAALYKCFGGKL